MSEPPALSGCQWNDPPALRSEIDLSTAASMTAVNLMKKVLVIYPVLHLSGGVRLAKSPVSRM